MFYSFYSLFVFSLYFSDVTIKKRGMVTLPGKGEVCLLFGQSHNVLLGWADQPTTLHHYRLCDNKLELLFNKPLPDTVTRKCYKYTTPNNNIIMSSGGKMHMFNSDLKLLKKVDIPGDIYGIMKDQYMVVSDYYTTASKRDGVERLSVRKLSSPDREEWILDVPPGGAYNRQDEIHARVTSQGSVAVVVKNKPHIDFYARGGEQIGTEKSIIKQTVNNIKRTLCRIRYGMRLNKGLL